MVTRGYWGWLGKKVRVERNRGCSDNHREFFKH